MLMTKRFFPSCLLSGILNLSDREVHGPEKAGRDLRKIALV